MDHSSGTKKRTQRAHRPPLHCYEADIAAGAGTERERRISV